jgi:Phage tail protein
MSLPWVPDAYCETHEWRSALGETIRFVTRLDAQQRMMPPVTIRTLRVPMAQGGRFQSARHEERLATIPVVLPGPQDGRDELRRWARALDPVKGEGTLTVVQGPHAGRQLVCTYETGLETFTEEYPFLGLTTLGFRAAEPYWQDATEWSVNADTGSVVRHWFPFLPLILSPSDVFAEVTINNTGDANAWPIVTVTGPGEELSIENETTGLRWEFETPIGAGSTLIVDHRPGHKAARLNNVNAFGQLTDDSTLWPIVAGPNRISIGFANATVATGVRFAWRNRWLSA